MKKRVGTIVAIAVVIILVGLLLIKPAPQIAIFINDTPASNLQIRELGAGVVAKTDRHGVAKMPAGVKSPDFLGFRSPTGGFQTISFPPYGRREYRFNGRTTTVIWHQYDYGIISSNTKTTTVSFTDEETRQLEAGDRTLEEFLSER